MFTAQLCADLEPVREMDAIYEHIIDDIVPLNIAGFTKYYHEKLRAESRKGRQNESYQG